MIIIKVAEEWNKDQAMLKEYLSSKGNYNEAIKLCLYMHAMVHSSTVGKLKIKTYDDLLWENLHDEICRLQSEKKNSTILWNIWHITRIEDLVTTILIKNENQTYDSEWKRKINTRINDTGNAMNRNEIQLFSKEVDITELRNYRITVGNKTQSIIRELKENEIKQKVEKDRLNRILDEEGVLKDKDSICLLDFWGRKTIAGLILMPITRHQIVHLNDAFKIKEKYMKNYSRN